MEGVQDLIINLSDHMRYLMTNEKEITELKKEIEFTKNYIELQNQMTGRKIEVSFDVEENLDNWNVPMLIIQTFVENSIKYAKLGSVNFVLKIQISISKLYTEDKDYLDIQISDNGQGYSAEVLESLSNETTTGNRHIGINNLRRRCQILYGESAEFSFYNMDGAVSECIIPEEKKNECIISR